MTRGRDANCEALSRQDCLLQNGVGAIALVCAVAVRQAPNAMNELRCVLWNIKLENLNVYLPRVPKISYVQRVLSTSLMPLV